MRITPENAIASLSISPSRIVGGETATGTVTLSSKAPTGGTVVNLDSNVLDARVPSSITIAEGGKTETFTVQTYDVSNDTEIWMTASVGRDRRSVQIRVVSARSGGTSNGTITVGAQID